MNETKEKKPTVKQFERRLGKLEAKLNEIERKISLLEGDKKRIKAEISECRDEQILFMVKSSKLTVEEIAKSIRLARSINQAGFTSEELDGLSRSDIEYLAAENRDPIDLVEEKENV